MSTRCAKSQGQRWSAHLEWRRHHTKRLAREPQCIFANATAVHCCHGPRLPLQQICAASRAVSTLHALTCMSPACDVFADGLAGAPRGKVAYPLPRGNPLGRAS